MSFPPPPPLNEPNDPNEPNQPKRPRTPSTKNKWTGAIVATALVLGVSALFGLGGMGVLGLGIGTVVAFFSVILGSALTIPRETRAFAIGFLIASAILMVVTAGVCVSVLSGL
jgi:hypothetical protein